MHGYGNLYTLRIGDGPLLQNVLRTSGYEGEEINERHYQRN